VSGIDTETKRQGKARYYGIRLPVQATGMGMLKTFVEELKGKL
jgi:hypothetical protein